MKIIDLEQGSEEWIKYRSTRIGATDFAVIAANAGLCPNIYRKSLKGLAKDKKCPQIITPEKQLIFDEGHQWEKYHLNQINDAFTFKDKQSQYESIVVEKDNYPFLFASLDGYCESNSGFKRILEIKTITDKRVNFLGLLNYWCFQMIHQIFVVQTDSARLIVACKDEVIAEFLLEKASSNEFHLKILIRRFYYDDIGKIYLSELDWLLMCEDFIDNYLIGEIKDALQ